MAVIHTSVESFEKDVLKAELPVFVDFWAEWCGPCKAISPFVDSLDQRFEGKVLIVKMDVSDRSDQTQALLNRYSVKGFPGILMFKNGEVVEKILGPTPFEMASLIKRHISE